MCKQVCPWEAGKKNKKQHIPRFGVQIIKDFRQQMPVDATIQTVLQQDALVAVTRRDHAAVHEIELDELGVGQVQVHCYQLTAAALCTQKEI